MLGVLESAMGRARSISHPSLSLPSDNRSLGQEGIEGGTVAASIGDDLLSALFPLETANDHQHQLAVANGDRDRFCPLSRYFVRFRWSDGASG
jgi:hypothetical protein